MGRNVSPDPNHKNSHGYERYPQSQNLGTVSTQCCQVCELMLLALSDVGQLMDLDLGWNYFSQQFLIIDFMACFWRFIEDVITKTIDYHLFDVVVGFH
ncbi:hypothetical protein Tco_1348523, partial [Tanacetum coccineum]